MPQALTAQREPSMEEILASIRRIIEDGDAPRRPGALPQNDEGADIDVSAFEAELDAAPEIDAFRDELGSDRPHPEFAFEVEEPIQLVESGLLMPEIEMEAPEPTAAVAVDAKPLEGEARMRDMAATLAGDRNFSFLVGRGSGHDDPASDAARPAINGAADPAAVETSEHRQSIISEMAGRQVAAAFGELSEAFAASRRKSFDEMAEEMMRPMLQDWLDNNLPTMVERLVREEIEKIARGTR